MFVYRAGQLVGMLSLRRFISSAPRDIQLPVVLCVDLRPHGLFLIELGMFVCVLLVHLMGMVLLVRLCQCNF